MADAASTKANPSRSGKNQLPTELIDNIQPMHLFMTHSKTKGSSIGIPSRPQNAQ
jgi:hypothetical protein